jgi:hypothetical protein
MVDIFKNGKLGKKCKSATEIEWMPPVEGEHSGVLYGADKSGQLFTIDHTTGVGTPVGVLAGCGGLSTEIEWDAATGTAWSQSPNGFFDGHEFDITTGTPTGACVPNGGSHTGIETVGGVWYATVIFGGGGAFPSSLHTFDIVSGVTTPLGLTGVGAISGLAYDAGAATMYGIAGGPGPAMLYTINLGTGVASPVGPTSMQAGSLQFGPNGMLYAGGTGPNVDELHSIDTASGASVLIGNTNMGGGGLTGLTFVGGGSGASDLKVDVVTRVSPGKGHKTPKFAPTSCGALYLNDGAIALLKDENGLVLDPPITGDPVVVAGPTDPICLVAVEDLNGSGIVLDGSGDEDNDNLTDYEEACEIGTDPCLWDTDGDGVSDGEDECPLEGNMGNGVNAVGCPIPEGFVAISNDNACTDVLEAGVTASRLDENPSPCDYGLYLTNGEFSCASCDTADFTDAVTRIGDGAAFCGTGGRVPRTIVNNDLQICARSLLTGNKWDIDYLTHDSNGTCIDNDGGVSCAFAATVNSQGFEVTTYIRIPFIP